MFQCIPARERCDNTQHCLNGMDEQNCISSSQRRKTCVCGHRLPPLLVNFVGADVIISDLPVNETSSRTNPCPYTHVQCPGDLLCLPVYVRCNNVYDCPGHEDEAECDAYSAPAFYRCRASRIHLHMNHMCDGHFQCPQKDDELFCDWTCPNNCTCYGSAFFCSSSFSFPDYEELRFLEGRGSGMKPADFASNTMLIHLGLASCGLTQLSLPTLHNLHSLDVSDNYLRALNSEDLTEVHGLIMLSLSGNPLSLQTLASLQPLLSLTVLDLSHLNLPVFNVSISAAFPNIQRINLSYSNVRTVTPADFQNLSDLRVLDLRGCPFEEFHSDMFRGLQRLEVVYSDNYKLCCSATLPQGFNLKNCHAPSDEVSSCDALLRSKVYRVLWAFFSGASLVGNFFSCLHRVLSSELSQSGLRMFVTHLCVSDFLMGVYLAVIGIADSLYRGSYLWQDEHWRHSILCQVVGVLSLLSSEVSVFIVFLITLDRFLVLNMPFIRINFSQRAALMACGMVWCGGLILAVVPLMPGLSHWQYYSQTGICIPIPITKKTFGGQKYSFGVMIVLNFLLSLLISFGQLTIYRSSRSNTMCVPNAVTDRKSKDLIIAHRLFTVAMSDFLCWFPFGLLGLLASRGLALPVGVNVAMAIIVPPLNSVLNPLLYTLSLIQERRRKAKEILLKQRLMLHGQQQADCKSSGRAVVDKLEISYTKQEVCLLLERWLHDQLLSEEHLVDLLEKET